MCDDADNEKRNVQPNNAVATVGASVRIESLVADIWHLGQHAFFEEAVRMGNDVTGVLPSEYAKHLDQMATNERHNYWASLLKNHLIPSVGQLASDRSFLTEIVRCLEDRFQCSLLDSVIAADPTIDGITFGQQMQRQVLDCGGAGHAGNNPKDRSVRLNFLHPKRLIRQWKRGIGGIT